MPDNAKRSLRDRAEKRVNRATARAQRAIDSAGIADDNIASLSLARNLVARGRVSDLALMDVTDPTAVLALLDELAITPSAEAAHAGARAALAEEAAVRAITKQEAAERAFTDANLKATAAEERLGKAQEELQMLESRRDTAIEQQNAADERARDADERTHRPNSAAVSLRRPERPQKKPSPSCVPASPRRGSRSMRLSRPYGRQRPVQQLPQKTPGFRSSLPSRPATPARRRSASTRLSRRRWTK